MVEEDPFINNKAGLAIAFIVVAALVGISSTQNLIYSIRISIQIKQTS